MTGGMALVARLLAAHSSRSAPRCSSRAAARPAIPAHPRPCRSAPAPRPGRSRAPAASRRPTAGSAAPRRRARRAGWRSSPRAAGWTCGPARGASAATASAPAPRARTRRSPRRPRRSPAWPPPSSACSTASASTSECLGRGMKIRPGVRPIEHDTELAHSPDDRVVENAARLEIIIIVAGDSDEGDAVCRQALDGGENIVAD